MRLSNTPKLLEIRKEREVEDGILERVGPKLSESGSMGFSARAQTLPRRRERAHFPQVYHRPVTVQRRHFFVVDKFLPPASPTPPTMGHSHGLRAGTRVCSNLRYRFPMGGILWFYFGLGNAHADRGTLYDYSMPSAVTSRSTVRFALRPT